VAQKSYGVDFAELSESQTRAVSDILEEVSEISIGVKALGEGTLRDRRGIGAYIQSLDKEIATVSVEAEEELTAALEEEFEGRDFVGYDRDADKMVKEFLGRQREAEKRGISAAEFMGEEKARIHKDRTEGIYG